MQTTLTLRPVPVIFARVGAWFWNHACYWRRKGDTVTQGTVFIQYKGTDICFDFWCWCGAAGHFDGYFAHSARCPGCGQVWVLPHTLTLVRVEAADAPEESDRQWLSAHAVAVKPEDHEPDVVWRDGVPYAPDAEVLAVTDKVAEDDAELLRRLADS